MREYRSRLCRFLYKVNLILKKRGIERAIRKRVAERRWKICRSDFHWKIAISRFRNKMINAHETACVRTCIPGGVHRYRRKFSAKFSRIEQLFLRRSSLRSRVVGAYHAEKAGVRIGESRDYWARDICRMFSPANVFDNWRILARVCQNSWHGLCKYLAKFHLSLSRALIYGGAAQNDYWLHISEITIIC